MEDAYVSGTGRHYSHLLRPVTPTPTRWKMVTPRAAIAESRCFDGVVRVYDVDVVATALEVQIQMLLIEQPDGGSGWGAPWFAWLPVERVQLKP